MTIKLIDIGHDDLQSNRKKLETNEASKWSRDGIDRNGCPSSGLLILSRARSAAFGGQRPLTGSTDRKHSLSVAINALLCL
jgi:hypothetical protein